MAFLPAILGPVLGALAGAGATYGLSKLDKGGGSLSGTPEQFRKIRTGTKEAQQFQQQLFKSGGGLPQSPLYQQAATRLQDLLSNNPEAMQAFEAPYMENFQQNILPQIAERFSAMGTGAGAINSSAFQNSIAQAGRGLQRDLATLRAGMQQQAIPQSLAFAQAPLTNMLQAMNWSPYQTTYTQRQPGFYDSLAQVAPGAIQSGLNQIDWSNLFGPSTAQKNLGTMQNAVWNAAYQG